MKNSLLAFMALAVVVSMGCKTSRSRGDRGVTRTNETKPTEKETPLNDRAQAESLIASRQSQLDSVIAELAIMEREQKNLQGDPPSAERDQAIQDRSIKTKMLQRDRKALEQEIARIESRLADLPAGEMTEEELDTDALLRMAEEEAFRQDELARAREADRRRREEDRRRREEERRMEEASRREAETAQASEESSSEEVSAGPYIPFEERFAATILRIRTRLADHKRW